MQAVNNTSIWDNGAMGIVVADRHARILKANKVFCALLGYSEYELLQKSIWDLTVPDDVDMSKERFEQLMQGLIKYYTIEKRYAHKDGRILWVHGIITPLDDRTYIGFIENIVSRKNMEHEAAIAYQQAIMYANDLAEEVRRRQRVSEDLQHFLYIAAHDLQEPIRTAANHVQLLEQRVQPAIDLDAEAADAVKVVKENLRWTTQLINSLLRYSRIDSSDATLVNACTLIESVKHILSLLIQEKQAQVEIDCDCSLHVLINQVNAQRVLQNLVQNALKYSTQPIIKITCEVDGRYVRFTVADNGTGIDQRYFELIFQPFKRLVKTIDGTGIGLAECKRIVELHGGHIWVDSEIGRGSTFYFTLPLGTG